VDIDDRFLNIYNMNIIFFIKFFEIVFDDDDP